MQDKKVNPEYLAKLFARIREGVAEGIRQEVERRRRLGIPLYVSRNGHVECVMADGSPAAPNSKPRL